MEWYKNQNSYTKCILFSGICQVIEKGKVLRMYENWGKYFSIQFDIVVKKLPKSTWLNVFHFTAGGNFEKLGDRIPGLWINKKGRFYFCTSLNNNKDLWKLIDFKLGQTYHVTITQSNISNKFWYEIKIDNETKLKIENSNPQSWSKVYLYTSNPWVDAFTSEFGSICNLKISYKGKS